MENRNVTSACAPAPSTATRTLYFRMERIANAAGNYVDILEQALGRLAGSAPSSGSASDQSVANAGVLGEYEVELARAEYQLGRLSDLVARLEKLV